MTDFPLPSNVKEVLSRLPVKDQVVMRSYIAGLRDQLKEYKVRAENADDDPHAHYHGHEKCTADHGHDSHGHADEKEAGHDAHEHKHHEHEHKHEDGHTCEHEHEAGHSHEHGHSCEHEHKEAGHSHEHAHDHKEKKDEEMPAWKKRAMESGGDANAAPFGGSWGAESSMDATK